MSLTAWYSLLGRNKLLPDASWLAARRNQSKLCYGYRCHGNPFLPPTDWRSQGWPGDAWPAVVGTPAEDCGATCCTALSAAQRQLAATRAENICNSKHKKTNIASSFHSACLGVKCLYDSPTLPWTHLINTGPSPIPMNWTKKQQQQKLLLFKYKSEALVACLPIYLKYFWD